MTYKLTFGKFKDTEIDEVPNTYLGWCVDNIKDAMVVDECRKELIQRGRKGVYIEDDWEIDYEELDMWDYD